MSKKNTRPPALPDGLYLSKPWKDHSEEEKEAIYPRARREANMRKVQELTDSMIDRYGEELVELSVEGNSEAVAKIPAPAPLSIGEAIPELKLVEVGFDVVTLEGTTGRILRFLGTDRVPVEIAEAFASGTRLPCSTRTTRARIVEDSEKRTKATEGNKKGQAKSAKARVENNRRKASERTRTRREGDEPKLAALLRYRAGHPDCTLPEARDYLATIRELAFQSDRAAEDWLRDRVKRGDINPPFPLASPGRRPGRPGTGNARRVR